MKEQLYTIPLNDAVNANDECPFCFISRNVEQDLIDYCLGPCASYMESDMRSITDRMGFCNTHFKKMFDYGNALGNAWILKTHMIAVEKDFAAQIKHFAPSKRTLKDKLLGGVSSNPLVVWAKQRQKSCYICEQFATTYARYLDTFLYLWQNDSDFKRKIETGKGLCIPHFGDLCEAVDAGFTSAEAEEFYRILLPVMQKNLERVREDVSWLIEKYDYENHEADWKNAKDSIQRSMQKLGSGYPADAPFHKSR